MFPICFAILVLFAIGLPARPAHAQGQTQIRECEGIFDATLPLPGSLDWMRARNREVNEVVRRSPNHRAIENWIRDELSNPTTIKSFRLDDGAMLELVDQGLGEHPTELILVKDGQKENLFSNLMIARNHSYSFVDFSVSGDEKTVAMAFGKSGSIDEYRIVLFDLETRRVIRDNLQSSSNKVAWISPDQFLIKGSDVDGRYFLRYDRKNQNEGKKKYGTFGDPFEGWTIIQHHRDRKSYLQHDMGRKIELSTQLDGEIVGVSPVAFFIATENGNGEILKVARNADHDSIHTATVFAPQVTNRLLISTKLRGQTIFATYRWGLDIWTRIINQNRQVIDEIKIPTCCSLKDVKWANPGKKVEFAFNSAIHSNRKFIYDVETKTWENPLLEQEMMTKDGILYKTEIVESTSADGTKIPMRLTMRNDVVPNGTVPFYFNSYGGFNRTGYVDPAKGPLMLEFLRRGGVYAGAALRGGNEFGNAWYQAGIQEKKINSVHDLIASVRWAIDKGWTRREFIIAHGASNGGMVNAAAGLIAPEVFGLIIPLAGVHDLGQIRTLDPLFARGWERDFPRSAELLTSLSPVELARQARGQIPRYLLMTGRTDSRVNADHTARLHEALTTNPNIQGQVFFHALNHTGHFAENAHRQDHIALRMQVIQWTFIFNQLGWSW